MQEFIIKVSCKSDSISGNVIQGIFSGIIKELDTKRICSPENVEIHNLTEDVKDVSKWLKKRINKEEVNRLLEKEINLKIAKGGKLTAYKETLNYLINHIYGTKHTNPKKG